jgi:hypothetical protein
MEGKGRSTGPALCDEDGFMIQRCHLNGELHSMMLCVQVENEGLIPKYIEVEKKFNIHRSFRRGVTTRAKEQGVDKATIAINNRWRSFQNKQGSMPRLPMSQLYVEITQVLTSKLRFSKSL